MVHASDFYGRLWKGLISTSTEAALHLLHPHSLVTDLPKNDLMPSRQTPGTRYFVQWNILLQHMHAAGEMRLSWVLQHKLACVLCWGLVWPPSWEPHCHWWRESSFGLTLILIFFLFRYLWWPNLCLLTRDALNLLKKADAKGPEVTSTAPATAPPHLPPVSGRPAYPPVSVPGKPGAPVSTESTSWLYMNSINTLCKIIVKTIADCPLLGPITVIWPYDVADACFAGGYLVNIWKYKSCAHGLWNPVHRVSWLNAFFMLDLSVILGDAILKRQY